MWDMIWDPYHMRGSDFRALLDPTFGATVNRRSPVADGSTGPGSKLGDARTLNPNPQNPPTLKLGS